MFGRRISIRASSRRSPRPKGGEIDFVVVRENTEGEYAQVGGFVYQLQPDEVAIQTSVFTRRGIERIVRFAFELAVKRNKKKRVTSITKSNAQGYSMVLWDRTFGDVAAEFPDIETESLLVDAAAMNFIRRPESFDVVVGSNLFCDILSDISAIIIGSMGLAASANLDPQRRFPSMFEPVHGSAPDIAGKGIVNPLATILSAGMMLEHLEMRDAARQVEAAVAAVLAERQRAHAGPRGQEQHRRSHGRGAGETRLVARTGDRHAFLVGAGIFLSRIFGLVRQRVFSHYFGHHGRRGRIQRRPSAFPTSCKTSSAKACFRRRSSRCTRGCWRRRTRRKPDASPEPFSRLLALARFGHRAGRRARRRRISSSSSRRDSTGAKRELTVRLRAHPVSPAQGCWCCPRGAWAS